MAFRHHERLDSPVSTFDTRRGVGGAGRPASARGTIWAYGDIDAARTARIYLRGGGWPRFRCGRGAFTALTFVLGPDSCRAARGSVSGLGAFVDSVVKDR